MIMNGTHEIIELAENYVYESKNRGKQQQLGKAIKKHSIEDGINKLFEAIGHSEGHLRDDLHKSAMKRPMRIGISEPVSLKQALRGLCISQASETAAVKKRMSRLLTSPGVLEPGATKTAVIETRFSALPVDEVKGNMMEISVVPERSSLSPNFNVKNELTESSKRGFGTIEQSLMTLNVAKKTIVPTKSWSKHNEGAKNDQDFLAQKVFHKMPLEKGREELGIVSSSSSSCKTKSIVMKADERSRSKEKGEFSQSSKISIGEYSSSTTSYSEESYVSGSSRSGYRPHMSKDLRWEAISVVQKQDAVLGMKNFKLLKKIGGGDIATVYLSELIGTGCLFAVKVMDNEFLVSRKKMHRAQTEKDILEILDHPFLPTLYVHFTTRKYSCLVMEYCPGGDLHVLRQKQLTRSFPEKAARFYAAEILLALEYLHMLGVVYRDLKPENILVREDGHIMLSDFDLSLRCAVNPTLLNSSSDPPKKTPSPSSASSCIHPFCLQPSFHLSCFTPRFLTKTRKLKTELGVQVIPLPQLVVEPITARSNSFVGTHEYLAPEIIKGGGHGSAVDWWTFGIFLYELLYGRTPFKGTSNEETVSNVVSECLKFPQCPMVSSHAQDLIRRLLKKEPESRLGSTKGAAEIKQHSFFEGLNWALIRCETPPELPRCFNIGKVSLGKKECENGRDGIEFEMFSQRVLVSISSFTI